MADQIVKNNSKWLSLLKFLYRENIPNMGFNNMVWLRQNLPETESEKFSVFLCFTSNEASYKTRTKGSILFTNENGRLLFLEFECIHACF